jgi:hypothetical protein
MITLKMAIKINGPQDLDGCCNMGNCRWYIEILVTV